MKKKIEIKEQIFVLMKSKKIEEVEHCTDLRSLDEFLDFDEVEQQGIRKVFMLLFFFQILMRRCSLFSALSQLQPEKGCTFSRNSSTAVRDVFGCIAVMLLLLALPLLIHFISMKTLLCAQGTSTHLSIMFIQEPLLKEEI